MLKPLFSLRTTVWPLATPLQMLDQTVPNVAFDLTVGTCQGRRETEPFSAVLGGAREPGRSLPIRPPAAAVRVPLAGMRYVLYKSFKIGPTYFPSNRVPD